MNRACTITDLECNSHPVGVLSRPDAVVSFDWRVTFACGATKGQNDVRLHRGESPWVTTQRLAETAHALHRATQVMPEACMG